MLLGSLFFPPPLLCTCCSLHTHSVTFVLCLLDWTAGCLRASGVGLYWCKCRCDDLAQQLEVAMRLIESTCMFDKIF